ncbi:MAG: hypothetical protein U5L11_02620 [Arhodomonas sp.]|nr:hypothetical protein [Arhodomonas sp.]
MFWLGHIDEWGGMRVIRDLCRLPYKSCWFELASEYDEIEYTLGILVAEHDVDDCVYFSMTIYRKRKNLWNVLCVCYIEKNFTGDMKFFPPNEDAETTATNLRMLIGAFLTAMHCVNVKKCSHEPSKKLQRKREKRGKKPLFSYWTLQLTNTESERKDFGGTHASPRVHLRRGHPRQLPSGKVTWVQPHMVGKGPGLVHKDYDGELLTA